LLGNNSLVEAPVEFLGNPDTAYAMRHTAQASAAIATAYYYDRFGMESDPATVAVWSSGGTLLGVSPPIAMLAVPGWLSVSWAGPTLVAGTTYYIGIIAYSWFYTMYDETSPALVGVDWVANSYATPGDLVVGADLSTGSFTIYVTS
jgi:hypothetical protein